MHLLNLAALLSDCGARLDYHYHVNRIRKSYLNHSRNPELADTLEAAIDEDLSASREPVETRESEVKEASKNLEAIKEESMNT